MIRIESSPRGHSRRPPDLAAKIGRRGPASPLFEMIEKGVGPIGMNLLSPPSNPELAGRLLFLGTGTWVGVPCIGCDCADLPKRQSEEPANAVQPWCSDCRKGICSSTRRRLRSQLLERIGVVHSLLFTHDHADHLFGFEQQLRIFFHYLHRPLPTFCEDFVKAQIRKSFDYAFLCQRQCQYGGGVHATRLSAGVESGQPFEVLGQVVLPLRLGHGKFKVLGFRFGNVAYCARTRI